MNEIEEKRLNVVIFGLPETQTQDRSTARDLDVGCLDGILEKITGHKVDFDVKFRIGAKAESKIRPIVVKVSSLQAKEKILKKSAALRDHQQSKDVYIKPDLTKLQRTLFKKHEEEMKQEAERRNELLKNGEEFTWVTRGGGLQQSLVKLHKQV